MSSFYESIYICVKLFHKQRFNYQAQQQGSFNYHYAI